jgi:D-sedoheptulose 7-phosphate isomerase
MQKRMNQIITEAIELKQKILEDQGLITEMELVIQQVIKAYRAGQKVLFCGNGGSAADAQHLAAELSGKFYLNRPPLFAEALQVNTSYLTAVGNDYSFEETFARAILAKGSPNDVLMTLSTSGNSPNIIKALKTARQKGLINVGLTGKTGGKMNDHCDFLIRVPSTDTPRIQEMHLLIGHIICELVEEELFSEK